MKLYNKQMHFAIFKQAQQLYDDCQYEYAIFLFTEAIKCKFNLTKSYYRRANCYMYMNKYKLASYDLEEVVKSDRAMGSAYVKQAKCYLILGDLDTAINAMESLRQLEPDNNFSVCELEKLKYVREIDKKARIHLKNEQWDKVIELMDVCLKKAEICIRFHLIKSRCLIYLARHEEALPILNEILFTHKDDVEAIYLRSLNLMYQERYNQGMIELKEILICSKEATEAYRNYKFVENAERKASTAIRNRNYESAKQIYGQIISIDRLNIRLIKITHGKLAEILYNEKNYEQCIEHCCIALEIEKTFLKALEFRLKCNMQLKEYELAKEDCAEILQICNSVDNMKKMKDIEEKIATLEGDNYVVLGVKRDVTIKELKKAFHKLALQVHPDKHPDKTKYMKKKYEIKFQKIEKAYKELEYRLNLVL